MYKQNSGSIPRNASVACETQGMHVSPAKHNYVRLPRKCDGQTDAVQSYPYVPLCFAGDTKIWHHRIYMDEQKLTVKT